MPQIICRILQGDGDDCGMCPFRFAVIISTDTPLTQQPRHFRPYAQ